MPWSLDARIPVHLGETTAPTDRDAFLIESTVTLASQPSEIFTPERVSHAADCACCVTRGPAAVALDRLFQRRARGEIAFFNRVVAITATPEGDVAVWSALRNDPLASVRFRLA